MPTVICFANMKGGVGKTTLCVNLGYELFSRRNKVLIVDNDPQFNATTSLVSPKEYLEQHVRGSKPTVYHIYEKPPRGATSSSSKPDAKEFIDSRWFYKGTNFSLDLLASQIELYDTLKNPTGKEHVLNRFLQQHAAHYDYVLIDCPPTPSILTTSAFAASDFVLIPVAPGYFATLGLPQFLGTLLDFKDNQVDAHDVQPLGAVFTCVDRTLPRDTTTSMARVKKELSKTKPQVRVFRSMMTKSAVYRNSLWHARPVHQYTGSGAKGKSLAKTELAAIADEMEQMLNSVRQQGTANA